MPEQRNGRVMRKYRNVLTYEDQYETDGWLQLELGPNAEGIILVKPNFTAKNCLVFGQFTAKSGTSIPPNAVIAVSPEGWHFNFKSYGLMGIDKPSSGITANSYFISSSGQNIVADSDSKTVVSGRASVLINAYGISGDLNLMVQPVQPAKVPIILD